MKDKLKQMLGMSQLKRYGLGHKDSGDEGSSDSQTAAKTEQTSFCHTANDRDE